MKNLIFCVAMLLVITAGVGCSHSIKIKGARFVAPVTAEKQWGGSVSISAGADTRVTVVENIDNNPPTRGPILINQDVDAGDLFGFNFLGFEAGLGIFKAIELYLDNAALGLRWQFLNHGEGADSKWVAAIQAAYASGSQGTSYEEESGTSSATSDIDRVQGGVSIGYKANEHLMPYLSYLHETYDVKTKVKNNNGDFGPYKDEGKHQFVALGLMSPQSKFLWAVEYNHILIDWDRATKKENQDVVAVRLGFRW